MIAVRISDATLWREVQERAAVHGWDDRERVLREAHSHIARRLKLRDDEARDDLRGRMDRLWMLRAEVLGA